MPRKQIVYGNANYADLVEKNGYFVDKTPYIAKLERVENPIYLRPRRFGKSTFCSLLNYYYDLNETARFTELFGETWIGQNPTGKQNRYMVLSLNFSSIDATGTFKQIEAEFKQKCNTALQDLQKKLRQLLGRIAHF